MINFSIEQMKNCRKSGAIIINTFYELEKEVVDALATYYPPIYTIGPLANLAGTFELIQHLMIRVCAIITLIEMRNKDTLL